MDYVIDYYQRGLFDKADMQLFTSIGWITPDQYSRAVGEPYPAVAAK